MLKPSPVVCNVWISLMIHLTQGWGPTLTTGDRSRSQCCPWWLSNQYPKGVLPGNRKQRRQPGGMSSHSATLPSRDGNTPRTAVHTTEGPRWTKSSQTDCVPWNIGPLRGLAATKSLALHHHLLLSRYPVHGVLVQARMTGKSAGAKWRLTPPQINMRSPGRPMPLLAPLWLKICTDAFALPDSAQLALSRIVMIRRDTGLHSLYCGILRYAQTVLSKDHYKQPSRLFSHEESRYVTW